MTLRQAPILTAAMLAANPAQRAEIHRATHWGESTALVDRNFLFFTLCLLPQKRYEVGRIAQLVRMPWSVTRRAQRHELRAARPERLLNNAVTEREAGRQ
jgi:hypothetical protein